MATLPPGAVVVKKPARLPPGARVVRKAAPQEVDFDAGIMLSNIPESAYRYGAGIVDAAVHPVRTGQAIGGLARSLLKRGQRGVNQLVSGTQIAPEGEESANALIEGTKNRYGSIDAFQQTLMDDPVGVLGDVSAITGAGAALRIPGAARVGAMLEPVNVASKTTRIAGKHLLPRSIAPKLYEHAIKPSTRLSSEDAAKIVQTGLDEGLMPTQAGLNSLKAKIKAPKTELKAKIAEATNMGIGIPSTELFKYLDDLKKDVGGVLVEAGPDLRKIQKVEKELIEQLNGRLYLTPKEVQRFKVDAYKKIKWANREGKAVKEEAYKALAKGAKESIETAVPGAKRLNEQQAPLLNAQKTLTQATRRIENQPMTFGLPIGVGVVAGDVMGSPALGTATAIASKIANMPKVKAKLAISLNKLKKNNIDLLNQNTARAQQRLVLALAARQEEERRRQAAQE